MSYRFLGGKPGDAIALDAADAGVQISAPTDSLPATFGSLTGTVRDRSGNVLSGATVSLEGPAVAVETDKLGQFAITGIPAGEVELTVSANGYETSRIRVDVVAGKTITLQLVLYPKGGQ